MDRNTFSSSVIICTYNGEKYIDAQLQSILNQTCKADEIIICDDNSTDTTVSILERYESEYDNIRLYRNSENTGARKNFEKALKLTTNEIIFFSDQDDIWHNDKIEIYFGAFTKNKRVLGIFSNGWLINDKGDKSGQTLFNLLGLEQKNISSINPENIFEHLICNGNIVTGATLAIKKEAKQIVCPFRLMDKVWHDEWIALILSNRKQLMLLNLPLIEYRIHSDQQVGTYSEETATHKNEFINSLKAGMASTSIFFKDWVTAFYRVSAYQEYIQLPKQYETIRQNLRASKYDFLKGKNFFIRKWTIFKWALSNYADTHFREIFNV